MWWKITLAVLILMAVFFVIGLYAGAATYLFLTTDSTAGTSFMTLFDANQQALSGRAEVWLPWSWAVTVGLTFLPAGVSILALLCRIKPQQSNLHGNARFANNKELEQFAYKGEYH